MASQNRPSPPRDGHRHASVPGRDEQVARLEEEVAQLRQAVASHAVIDQAVGVVVCLHQLSPADGFTVLRVTSQLANTKLHAVAEAVIGWAHTRRPLPAPLKEALNEALRTHPDGGTAGS
ncbi:ANTAR domain-containing protein [Streptomyces collinus]|uniref:ANTAR domain-containing protein n=1 Tax=Streptomyces collinus TaxID=42684 RepID=UPI00363153D0